MFSRVVGVCDRHDNEEIQLFYVPATMRTLILCLKASLSATVTLECGTVGFNSSIYFQNAFNHEN